MILMPLLLLSITHLAIAVAPTKPPNNPSSCNNCHLPPTDSAETFLAVELQQRNADLSVPPDVTSMTVDPGSELAAVIKVDRGMEKKDWMGSSFSGEGLESPEATVAVAAFTRSEVDDGPAGVQVDDTWDEEGDAGLDEGDEDGLYDDGGDDMDELDDGGDDMDELHDDCDHYEDVDDLETGEEGHAQEPFEVAADAASNAPFLDESKAAFLDKDHSQDPVPSGPTYGQSQEERVASLAKRHGTSEGLRISSGCLAGEKRCMRNGSCLSDTAKCCKGGKTYCPGGFYCINNGKSCCRVGKWCPLYAWDMIKRDEHNDLISAYSSEKSGWGLSIAMDFRLG